MPVQNIPAPAAPRVKPTDDAIGYQTTYHTSSTTLLSEAGYVYWVVIYSKDNTPRETYLKDSASTVWATGTNRTQYNSHYAYFDPPLRMTTSIVLTLGSLCRASVCYSKGTLA